MSYFSISQGNRLPIVRAELTDDDGYVNLTSQTCYFVYRPKFSGVAPTTGLADVVEAVSGSLEYSWEDSDVSQYGIYYCQWKVSGSNGWSSYPNNSYLKYYITPSL